MKKDNRINPVGLKGNEINERMKELMGISSINENKSTSVVELTKIGPDGNAYAIVRENHEYYIKTTTKKEALLSEDFKYIGGLKNKKSEAYPSYAKAIKHLNLKFNSLAEALNKSGNINVFENDNLVSEDVAGFSNHSKGGGFSGEGNLEGNKSMFEEADMDENSDDEKLTEDEQAVEDMAKDEESEKPTGITEHKLSIAKALENMDAIIDSLTEGKTKKKVYTIK
jgi:hypothetical protein